VKVVCDTGPLVTQLGRDLVVPLPVAVETDQLLRSRVDPWAARLFLFALAKEPSARRRRGSVRRGLVEVTPFS
jgi:hypothetical protein